MDLDGRSGKEPAPAWTAGEELDSGGQTVRWNPMWIVSLHVAACRRWLESEPPRLGEVDASLRTIEDIGSYIR